MFKWPLLAAIVWASLAPDVSAGLLRRRCRGPHHCRPICVTPCAGIAAPPGRISQPPQGSTAQILSEIEALSKSIAEPVEPVAQIPANVAALLGASNL